MKHSSSLRQSGSHSNPRSADAVSRAMGRTLSLWCFSASVAMRELTSLGVRSIILASGTLSPMEPYAAEMQVRSLDI